jgi:deoxyribodipyrimidine photo-lyase
MHLIWHRTELRTHDQPALHAAAAMARESNSKVLPLVVIDDKIFARADLTPRRRAWFLEHTRALRQSYRDLGCDLVVRQGEIGQQLERVVLEAREAGHPLTHAHFVRNYTPYAKERDAQAAKIFEKHGIQVLATGGQYTHEPRSVLTNEGKRYGVFGAYRKKWQTLEVPEIHQKPQSLPSLPSKMRIGEIPPSDSEIALPEAGEAAALKRLQWFVENAEADYARTRNEPGREESTSKLSYYFNIGALSPRLAMHTARTYKWKFELTWWDFFADVLDRLPESATLEARPEWRGFPWRHDEGDIERWKSGQTGFPYVDAGMRELNQTGFMHNNVRMYAASFLTKHLLIDWKVGEEIFRGLLLCGDRAQNVGNWQWIAGSGVDAAPFFRIYNPVTQGQKRDSKGEYVRRWIPELEDVPDELLHTPWLAPTPPRNYPAPMIDLAEGRERFLKVARERFKKKDD